jgi:tetratricopeptide (TPR) repeat protein
MSIRVVFLVLAAGGLGILPAQPQDCPGSPAADTMAEGAAAYNAAQYAKAAERFESATQLDPNCIMAWLYLGNSYLNQYVPGKDSPENREMAEKAREQFETVLGQQPENEPAMAGIALLYFQQKKWDDAKISYEKLTVVNEDNKQAFYRLGVIAFNRTSPALLEARAKLGMKPQDPGPIKDAGLRQGLRAQFLPAIEDGIERLQRAVEIEGEYQEAMTYLNLLYREKADLEDSAEEYRADMAQANDWLQQAREVRKDKRRMN